MTTHTFTSKLLVAGKAKDGNNRLRVSLGIRDYEFVSYDKEMLYFENMNVKRTTGETFDVKYPRISKGTKLGKYTPHYITIPYDVVLEHDLKVYEPVVVTLEW